MSLFSKLTKKIPKSGASFSDFPARLPSGYKWKSLTKEDYGEVKTFIGNYYSSYETSCAMLGMTKKEVLLSDRIILKESLKQNCSLSIVDKLTERIIAFLLITTSESLNLNPSKVSLENVSENHLIIGRMLNYFEDAYKKVLDVESKCSYNSMISVHPSYRNFGFASQLVRKSEHVAADLGCRYVIGAFSTSLYSQKVAEKLGYKTCVTLSYANYVDPITGKKPFKIPCPPHTQVKCFYKEL